MSLSWAVRILNKTTYEKLDNENYSLYDGYTHTPTYTHAHTHTHQPHCSNSNLCSALRICLPHDGWSQTISRSHDNHEMKQSLEWAWLDRGQGSVEWGTGREWLACGELFLTNETVSSEVLVPANTWVGWIIAWAA